MKSYSLRVVDYNLGNAVGTFIFILHILHIKITVITNNLIERAVKMQCKDSQTAIYMGTVIFLPFNVHLAYFLSVILSHSQANWEFTLSITIL